MSTNLICSSRSRSQLDMCSFSFKYKSLAFKRLFRTVDSFNPPLRRLSLNKHMKLIGRSKSKQAAAKKCCDWNEKKTERKDEQSKEKFLITRSYFSKYTTINFWYLFLRCPQIAIPISKLSEGFWKTQHKQKELEKEHCKTATIKNPVTSGRWG